MNYIEVLEKLTSSGIKANSAKNYLSNYKRVMNALFDNELSSEKLISDDYIDKIINYVSDDKVTLHSKDNILKGYFMCVRAIGLNVDNLDKRFKPLRSNYAYEKEFQQPSEKEIKNKLPMKEIIKKREEWKSKLKDHYTKNDLYYVALSMFTMLPCLRSEDCINTKLVIDSDNYEDYELENYLCLTKKKLIIKSYKTEGAHGPREIDIPDELIEVLTTFKQKSLSDWVVCSPKLNQLSSNNFCRLMNEATGKQISSSMMRKIFAKEEIIDKCIPVKEKRKIAQIMGHSVKTQQVHYSKFSEILHADDDNLTSLMNQAAVLRRLLSEVNEKIQTKLVLE